MAISEHSTTDRPGSTRDVLPLLTGSQVPRVEDLTPSLPSEVRSSVQVSTSKYPTLLPRPKSSRSLKSQPHYAGDKVPLGWLRRRCHIKICRRPNCDLRSHRQYDPSQIQKSKAEEAAIVNHKADGFSEEQAVARNARENLGSHSTILNGSLDAFPALPSEDLNNPVFKEMFHEFFNYEYDRVDRLLQPPSTSEVDRIARDETKRKCLAVGLSAPVYCLNYIGSAHQQIIFKRDYRRPDKRTMLLHGKIITYLRAKLDDFKPDEIGDLLLVIFTLIMFEVAVGRTHALRFHRTAVQHLLKVLGGIHNLKRLIPVVLTLDRTLSIFTCEPPLYDPPERNLIRKPQTVPVIYGAYFDDTSSSSTLGSRIHQYCVDGCRIIEIFEWEGISFNPSDPPLHCNANINYFFFLRDCLVDDFVRLNVQTAKEYTLPRCVLLTAKLVDYNVVMDGYLKTLSVDIAKRIQKVLCHTKSEIDWKPHRPLLLWILFVMTTLDMQWDDRAWALQFLREQLELKYRGKTWPKEWRQYELNNVHRFVWSDLRFNTGFAKVCHELQNTFADQVLVSSVIG